MSQVDQYSIMVASGDVMNSSRVFIEQVLNAGKYKVLAYNGAWDSVVGADATPARHADHMRMLTFWPCGGRVVSVWWPCDDDVLIMC